MSSSPDVETPFSMFYGYSDNEGSGFTPGAYLEHTLNSGEAFAANGLMGVALVHSHDGATGKDGKIFNFIGIPVWENTEAPRNITVPPNIDREISDLGGQYLKGLVADQGESIPPDSEVVFVASFTNQPLVVPGIETPIHAGELAEGAGAEISEGVNVTVFYGGDIVQPSE